MQKINNELQKSYLDTIASFSSAVDLRDEYTNDRPYRRGASVTDAIKEVQNVKDTQLDGKIVDIFIQILQENSYAIKEACVTNSEK